MTISFCTRSKGGPLSCVFTHAHISNRQFVRALIVSGIYDFRERDRRQTMRSLVKYSANSNALHLCVRDLNLHCHAQLEHCHVDKRCIVSA
ncbi:hypothetical protein PUN28_007421 [Cardiocondyla obscurior]|uniref:Uncharacterized protein n=1 Tax=Cardiocondyla obscurior TaxID=286306 RepID=A0AAW2G3V1_9HYME